MYRRLLIYLRPYAGLMGGTIFGRIGASVLDGYSFALLIPFLNALFGSASIIPEQAGWLGRVLERTIGRLVNPSDPMGSLQNVILIILATVIAKNLLIWWSGQLGVKVQEHVTRDLRDAVYAHVQRLPLSYYTHTRTGQVISRVLSDTDQTKALITAIITQALQNASLVVVYVAVLFAISWRLTLLSLVAAPLLILALQPLLKRLRSGYRLLRNDHGELMSVLQEVVSGIRLVKSFGAEGYEERRFHDASFRYSKGLVRVTRYAFLAQPITEVIGTVVAVGLLWIGARQVVVEGTMEGAELIVFLTLVMRLLAPIKALSQIPTAAQASLAAAERVFEILDSPTETALDRGTREVTEVRDAISFEDVSFSYGDAAVVSNVSFTAHRGQVVALVGPSGAGKSTLVDLIPRFIEPVDGRILLDGVDTREMRLASLRSLIGVVSQDTVLFNDTVRDNIAYGAEGRFSQERIESAARAANAHEFIAELPNGYDTVLGERGTRLSGGQRQRIAIARALLLDPPILILDEATSALDSESERLVQEAIDRLLQGRTVFVIAHRLSTVEHADQILAMDRGRVVERGTHAELLLRGGMYSRLYSLQFRDRPPPAVA